MNISILLHLLQLGPYVAAAVKQVESTLHAEKAGATKKQLILDSVLTAAHVGEAVPDKLVSGVSTMIDAMVATYNAAGIFTHSSPATPPAIQPTT